MLPNRRPQVTFSCDSADQTCGFQFWTAQVESFYCALDQCISSSSSEYNSNSTTYACQKIKCSCVPGRFICGEDGSVGTSVLMPHSDVLLILYIDIGDFLREEIKGPATFSCKSNDCKFEEPAMNSLIDQIFGDAYISLKCDGGECLHYSQVPGYVVRRLFRERKPYLITCLATSQTRNNYLGCSQRC